MGYKLECTDRVRYPLEVVALPMGKVVHRVNVPCIPRAMVRMFYDTINNRIAEVHIA